jgi:hypothetical protein
MYTHKACDVSSFVRAVNCINEQWKINSKDKDGKIDPAVRPWFRGVGNESHGLIPSLMYLHSKKMHYDEFWINEQFRKRAMLMSDLKIHHDDIAMWLFLLRHHGAPSRLIDWTENALAALYFCVEQDYCPKEDNEKKDGVVYLLQPFLWNLAVTKEYKVPGPTHKLARPYFKLAFEQFKNPQTLYKYKKADFALALRPPIIDARMVAQRSVFTIHGKYLNTDLDCVDDGSKADLNVQASVLSQEVPENRRNDLLVKILIPFDAKCKIQQELALLGITRATLFPDMDGLVQELKFLFAKSNEPDSSIKSANSECVSGRGTLN